MSGQNSPKMKPEKHDLKELHHNDEGKKVGFTEESVADNDITTLLRKHKVSELVTKDRKVVQVDSKEKPKDAFAKIVEHHILSAPVWDDEAKEYVGFLDTRDLVQFVVFMAEEAKKEAQQKHDHLVPPNVDMRTIFDSAARFYQRPVEGVSTKYLARRNRFIPVSPDDSLLKVAIILSDGSHRVPVVDPKSGQVIDIISQSTVLGFLWQHRETLEKLLGETVDEAKLGSRPVIPVKSNTTALETFKVMAKYNRSGIAVVDETGKFVGNTSGSDLKYFLRNPHMKILNASIMDFLAKVRQSDVGTNIKSPVIDIQPTDSVAKVIGKLHATRVHRVFVVNPKHGYAPEAVISLTDILRFCLRFGAKKDQMQVTVETA